MDALRKLCTNKDNKPKFYIAKFDGHYASMKTDKGNSHGKVFYDDYILVYMWPPVKEEVRKHFEKNSYHQST